MPLTMIRRGFQAPIGRSAEQLPTEAGPMLLHHFDAFHLVTVAR
jgi:hypothetical protein